MKIIQIIGTRPNLTKFINITGKDFVVWTGQHYDEGLFAKEVKIDKWLKKGEILEEKGDLVIVYGDTFSALEGAHWAKERNILLAHIEAGVRLSSNERVEEAIRKEVDSLSNYLFCINEIHAENLRREDVKGKIFVVGDLLYDQYLKNRKHNEHGILTIHRREHILKKETLQNIFNDLESEGLLNFYCHPHTIKKIKEFNIVIPKNIEFLGPVSYERIISELRDARIVITDSGGLTRESYFSGCPVKNIGKTEWSKEMGMFGDGNAEQKIRLILKGAKL